MLVSAIDKHVDINSISFYARWQPRYDEMDMWLEQAGTPFLTTVFYTQGVDSGLGNESGAGWEVYTQQDRARHFENMALTLPGHRGSVGWTWFRYIDKNDANKGMLSLEHAWYSELGSAMHNMSRNVYRLRQLLLQRDR